MANHKEYGMKLVIRRKRNTWMWMAVFSHYDIPFIIGRVKKMPTHLDVCKIVKQWNIRVYDGVPYHLSQEKGRKVWRAFGTSASGM